MVAPTEWLDKLFEENPYMKNVYPGETRQVLEVFCIEDGEIEYFNLRVHPIFRESYVIGSGVSKQKVYVIIEDCTGCGMCREICPQKCITAGTPYRIVQENCLRCGSCQENCPVSVVDYTNERHYQHD
jgi:NAD-dependent dihydropyrimidine dehydrogenase PreA subunit